MALSHHRHSSCSRRDGNGAVPPPVMWRLYGRETCPDPALLSLPALKPDLYSLRSLVQRLQQEAKLEEHAGCVNCINFSPDGQLLASGSDDLHNIIWDWQRKKVLSKFDSGHIANVFQSKFMPHTCNTVLVTAARDGQIRCQALSSCGSLVSSRRVGHHKDSAHKLAVDSESPYTVLSCGEDGSVLQVDLRGEDSRNKILVCKENNRKIALYSIFIDPSNSNYFAISGRDQYARIYDRRKLVGGDESIHHETLKKFCPHHLQDPNDVKVSTNITCLVYSFDGREILCSYNDEDIYTFDTSHSTGSDFVKKFTGHRNSATVKGVNFFGLRSEYVVSGSDCGHVFLWDKDSQEIVQFLEGDAEGVVNCLEPHPHIPVLATSGLDHDIKIFAPTASKPTALKGLSDITKQNHEEREAAYNQPLNGYEMFMELIARQYRRGIRRRAGLPDSDSGSSSGVDMDMEEGGEEEDSGDSDEERPRIPRCIQS